MGVFYFYFVVVVFSVVLVWGCLNRFYVIVIFVVYCGLMNCNCIVLVVGIFVFIVVVVVV